MGRPLRERRHLPSKRAVSLLSDVSCTSATNCLAVGVSRTTPSGADTRVLSERWNGKTWSIGSAPGPNAAQVSLAGISCPGPKLCFALGGTSDSFGGRFRAFIDRWNGTAWSIIATPSFGSGNVSLNGIDCVSATNCFATGDITQPKLGNEHALIEHWDGNTWSVSGSSASGAS